MLLAALTSPVSSNSLWAQRQSRAHVTTNLSENFLGGAVLFPPTTMGTVTNAHVITNNLLRNYVGGAMLVPHTRRGTVTGLRRHPIRRVPRPGEVRGRLVRGVAMADSEGIKFPFMSGSAQKLLTEIAETLAQELGPHLQSSQTPSDVRYFRSAQGNAEGSVVLRAGKDSKVDWMLESWLHAVLPFGTLDIGSTVVMLGRETDSPHFLFELILRGSVLVILLDHVPRKDLVLDSAYLKRFYEDTEVDKIRQMFETAPECKSYISPLLFVRSFFSPTAAVFKLSGSEVEGGGLDEQIASVVHPGATQMLQLWLESFRSRGLPAQNADDMVKRDTELKTKGVEVNLSANLPGIYGPEITTRVVEAFRAGK